MPTILSAFVQMYPTSNGRQDAAIRSEWFRCQRRRCSSGRAPVSHGSVCSSAQDGRRPVHDGPHVAAQSRRPAQRPLRGGTLRACGGAGALPHAGHPASRWPGRHLLPARRRRLVAGDLRRRASPRLGPASPCPGGAGRPPRGHGAPPRRCTVCSAPSPPSAAGLATLVVKGVRPTATIRPPASTTTLDSSSPLPSTPRGLSRTARSAGRGAPAAPPWHLVVHCRPGLLSVHRHAAIGCPSSSDPWPPTGCRTPTPSPTVLRADSAPHQRRPRRGVGSGPRPPAAAGDRHASAATGCTPSAPRRPRRRGAGLGTTQRRPHRAANHLPQPATVSERRAERRTAATRGPRSSTGRAGGSPRLRTFTSPGGPRHRPGRRWCRRGRPRDVVRAVRPEALKPSSTGVLGFNGFTVWIQAIPRSASSVTYNRLSRLSGRLRGPDLPAIRGRRRVRPGRATEPTSSSPRPVPPHGRHPGRWRRPAPGGGGRLSDRAVRGRRRGGIGLIEQHMATLRRAGHGGDRL